MHFGNVIHGRIPWDLPVSHIHSAPCEQLQYRNKRLEFDQADPQTWLELHHKIAVTLRLHLVRKSDGPGEGQ